MHIRSVSYILGDNYQILSIADEFVELRHTSGSPFRPAEVWGKEIWAHIQHNGLAKTFEALFVRARRRPVSLPFRLDRVGQLTLWQIEAQAAAGNLLVCFNQLAHQPRPRLGPGESLRKPCLPLAFCGWCNRMAQPGQKPTTLKVEEAEYVEGLRMISPSAVSVKLCDECTAGLVRSHEPKYFEHLSLNLDGEAPDFVPTMHRQGELAPF